MRNYSRRGAKKHASYRTPSTFKVRQNLKVTRQRIVRRPNV